MSDLNAQDWKWIDYHDPPDMEQSSDVIVITSVEQLIGLAESASRLSPRIVVLRSPKGSRMSIGIGGSFAGIEFFDSPNSEVPLTCKPREVFENHEAYFSCEGETVRFEAKYLIPVAMAIRILVYFFQTTNLPDWINWV